MLRTFIQLAAEVDLQRLPSGNLATLYQFRTPDSTHALHGWGMSYAFHFNKGISAQRWVGLRDEVADRLHDDADLRATVEFVPYSEVGADFVVQGKPPFDGGYFLDSLNEWRTHGDTMRPPDGCESSHERLQAGVLRVMAGLPEARRDFLKHVLHATFIKDSRCQLQFVEDQGWCVYDLTIDGDWLGPLKD